MLKSSRINKITAKEKLRLANIVVAQTFPGVQILNILDISNTFSAKDKIGFKVQLKDSKLPFFVKIIFDVDSSSMKRRKKFAKDFAIMQIIDKGVFHIPTPKTILYRHANKYDFYIAEYLDNTIQLIDIIGTLKRKETSNLINEIATCLAAFHSIHLRSKNTRDALFTQFGAITPRNVWKEKKKSMINTALQAVREVHDISLQKRAQMASRRLRNSDTKLSLLHNDYIRNILIQDKKLKAIIDFEEVTPGDVHLELARARWWFEELGLPQQFKEFVKAYSKYTRISQRTINDYYLIFLLEYYKYAESSKDNMLLSNTIDKLKLFSKGSL